MKARDAQGANRQGTWVRREFGESQSGSPGTGQDGRSLATAGDPTLTQAAELKKGQQPNKAAGPLAIGKDFAWCMWDLAASSAVTIFAKIPVYCYLNLRTGTEFVQDHAAEYPRACKLLNWKEDSGSFIPQRYRQGPVQKFFDYRAT